LKNGPLGGSLFSMIMGLARLLVVPTAKAAAKALATIGLSFGAEKALKKIFGKDVGPQEIQLYNLVQQMTPVQKKPKTDVLLEKGLVCGRGASFSAHGGMTDGFLGMVASIGVPLAIDLVNKLFGSGMRMGPAFGWSRAERGMQIS